MRGRLVKLVKGGVTYEYQYSPEGLRSRKKVGGNWTYFLLDGASVVKEITGTTSVHTTQGPLIDQPLARNGRTFTVNHQGSTTTLTDGTGQVVQSYSYGPFGETTQSTGEVNPFQYAGRENDGATGLYYNRARYYRPEWGRFISADPIGFEGGLNHYAYAFNNPLGATDPSGLDPLTGWEQGVVNGFTTIGGILGGLGGGGIGGGLGFFGGLAAGPVAVLSAGAGGVAGAAIGSGVGAGLSRAVGTAVVTIANSVGNLVQFATSGSNGRPEFPKDAFRGKSAPERAYRFFEKLGYDRHVLKQNWHNLKKGLRGDDNVVIGRDGTVWDERTGEVLGNLLDG